MLLVFLPSSSGGFLASFNPSLLKEIRRLRAVGTFSVDAGLVARAGGGGVLGDAGWSSGSGGTVLGMSFVPFSTIGGSLLILKFSLGWGVISGALFLCVVGAGYCMSMVAGSNFLRNRLFLMVMRPEPSILTAYWSCCPTSTTTPVRSHLLG